MRVTRRASWSVAVLGLLAAGTGAGVLATSQAAARELDRIVDALAVQPGMTVADVGAGQGRQTLLLARYLGPTGRVFSTDVDAALLRGIEAAATAQGLQNITTVEADATRANLPDECCHGLLLRNVYHHFADPAAMNASLREALRPGGRILVVDFPPRAGPEGSGGERASGSRHGVLPTTVARELQAAGLEVVRTIDAWGDGRDFAVLARRSASP